MDATTRIRLLAAGDSLADLTALLHRAYAPLAAAGMHFVASHQSEEVTRRRIEGRTCVVVERRGRIVGTATLAGPGSGAGGPGPALYARPDVAHFSQFAVEPEEQRAGLGTRLLAWLEEHARGLGAGWLALDTSEHATALIRWYRARGYEPVGRHDWRPHVNYESVLLARRLGPG